MIGKNPLTLFQHSQVPSAYPDPDPAGIGQGLNEFALAGGGGPQGFTGASVIGNIFWTSPSIYMPTRIKAIYVQTFGTITWIGSGVTLLNIYAGRTQQTNIRSGATSQVNTGSTAGVEGYAGAATTAYQSNFGAAGLTLANKGWWFTPQDIPALQWPLGYVGVEIQFFAAPSAGSIAVAVYGQAA